MRKNILIKIYTPAGELIKTLDKGKFNGFVKEINAGLGECIVDLGEDFDYSGVEVNVGNIVEILISDKESVVSNESQGYKLIYRGYISIFEPIIENGKERTVLTVLGNYTRLSLDLLKDSAQTKLYTHSTTGISTSSPAVASDVGLVMRGIIDRYIAETTNPQINYTSTSIPLLGVNMTYTFQRKTYREALDKALSSAPAGYYYFIDANGTVWLKSKPTTATHKFVFGKDFGSIKFEKSLEKMRNFLVIWDNASLYKHYQDDTSIVLHGRRAARLVDEGINNEATADLIGEKFITENKDPEVRITCEVADSNQAERGGYDIESIEPGDTCTFFNFDLGLANIFKENMIITKVVYSLEKAEITVESFRSGLIAIQERLKKDIEQLEGNNNPASYT